MTEAFETERLLIRELADDDLEQIFDVYASNPRYLELTSGAGGEPGSFDLRMLERDVAVARAMPGRHVAGIYLEQTGEPVGALDWMEENPSDGMPWIGLVLVRAERQREGVAREAVDGLLDRLRDRGADAVRVAVVARNEPALALARSLGFHEASVTTRRLAAEEVLVVLERRLADAQSA